ncbi:Protein MEMO1-like protein [Diplonema papillatum]|nr:Protein MEMO1-like protein [Diplonema papillatum]KAJ9444072.1 Protein MEMO1-like protein [Diplonema papillatum]KAJ9445769.1 Protein MEMO1-like protein [Diplonema papillatum]
MAYSGNTASHCFKALSRHMQGVDRVFILGPSHVQNFDDIRFTPFSVYEMPNGDVDVDTETISHMCLKAKEQGIKVSKIKAQSDIDEHSLEMQMPFIAQLVQGTPAKIIPVHVGHISDAAAEGYGALFAPYLDDPKSRFVISSDFCHWGSRFRYTYHYKKDENPNIGDAIIAMDHEAMRIMEDQDRPALQRYFAATENTICGRNPITILLNTLALSARQYDLKFVHYSQSSKCRTPHDSSVSYAAAIVTEA